MYKIIKRYTDMIYNQKRKINRLKDKLETEEYLLKSLEEEKRLIKSG